MSASISERLKALGVNVGARELKPSKSSHPVQLEQTLGGFLLDTPQGQAFVVETRRTVGEPYGGTTLELHAPLGTLAAWAKESVLHQINPDEIVFLDTETTGLSGGTGTYPFLIGAGRFIENEFVLRQFFLRNPAEEAAQLTALESFIAPCQMMSTFNGKSFDVPVIISRYTIQGLRPPLHDLIHIDLLHLARRLWRDRLPSRTLPNLETQILGALRSEEDIPGWMIPEIYFNFLRDLDPTPLKNVFYHNAMDVISLAVLLDHMANLLDDPIQRGSKYGVDLIALAKLFEDLGDLERATSLYIHGLEHEDVQAARLPRMILLQALQRLAGIYKRKNDLQSAIRLWQQAAQHHHLGSCIELAKCYEHQIRDLELAILWTQTAISMIDSVPESPNTGIQLTSFQKREWLKELNHRLNRLEKKAGEPK